MNLKLLNENQIEYVVDIVNEIDGVQTETAIKTAVTGPFGDIQVPFLNRDELTKNKKASASVGISQTWKIWVRSRGAPLFRL